METAPDQSGPQRDGWLVAIIVSALLLIFAGLSYCAVLTKCATYDEPLHLVGGLVHRYLHDYRINP